MDITDLCHAWNRGTVSSNALSPSTRRRKLLAWSYGENDLSSSMPVCTLISVSTDEHLPTGTENPWTTWKALNRLRTQVGRSRVNMSKWGYFQTKQRLVTVASGRPCNIYWSAPRWTLPALLNTWQYLMALGGHNLHDMRLVEWQ